MPMLTDEGCASVLIVHLVPQLVTKVLKQMLRGLDIGNNSLGLWRHPSSGAS